MTSTTELEMMEYPYGEAKNRESATPEYSEEDLIIINEINRVQRERDEARELYDRTMERLYVEETLYKLEAVKLKLKAEGKID